MGLESFILRLQEDFSKSVAHTKKVSASSSKGFEDVVRKGIRRFAKTIENIEGAWIREQKVVVKDGEVSEYRDVIKVSFVLKDWSAIVKLKKESKNGR